jgi:addiction module HigA family antidote
MRKSGEDDPLGCENTNMAHPGELIRFFLIEEGILADTAAKEAGIPVQQMYDLIDGKIAVTPDLADKLGQMWGTTPQTWMNLQARDDEHH